MQIEPISKKTLMDIEKWYADNADSNLDCGDSNDVAHSVVLEEEDLSILNGKLTINIYINKIDNEGNE